MYYMEKWSPGLLHIFVTLAPTALVVSHSHSEIPCAFWYFCLTSIYFRNRFHVLKGEKARLTGLPLPPQRPLVPMEKRQLHTALFSVCLVIPLPLLLALGSMFQSAGFSSPALPGAEEMRALYAENSLIRTKSVHSKAGMSQD